jgi:hypothetical protein
MDNLDLVILISIIILILILNKVNKVHIVNESIPPIQKNNNIKNKKVDLKQLLNRHNNFYKKFITTKIDDVELNKLSISKGNITRDTVIGENGGSENYNKFIVDSNISNNLINYDNTNSTYKKLPYKIK